MNNTNDGMKMHNRMTMLLRMEFTLFAISAALPDKVGEPRRFLDQIGGKLDEADKLLDEVAELLSPSPA